MKMIQDTSYFLQPINFLVFHPSDAYKVASDLSLISLHDLGPSPGYLASSQVPLNKLVIFTTKPGYFSCYQWEVQDNLSQPEAEIFLKVFILELSNPFLCISQAPGTTGLVQFVSFPFARRPWRLHIIDKRTLLYGALVIFGGGKSQK